MRNLGKKHGSFLFGSLSLLIRSRRHVRKIGTKRKRRIDGERDRSPSPKRPRRDLDLDASHSTNQDESKLSPDDDKSDLNKGTDETEIDAPKHSSDLTEVIQSNPDFQHDERGSAAGPGGRSFGGRAETGTQEESDASKVYSMDSSSDDDDESEEYESDDIKWKWPSSMQVFAAPSKGSAESATKNKGPPKRRVQLICTTCGKKGFNNENELKSHQKKSICRPNRRKRTS